MRVSVLPSPGMNCGILALHLGVDLDVRILDARQHRSQRLEQGVVVGFLVERARAASVRAGQSILRRWNDG